MSLFRDAHSLQVCGEALNSATVHLNKEGPRLGRKGRTPWNKGLTSETDKRVKESAKKYFKTLKERYARGEIKPWNKGKTGLQSWINTTGLALGRGWNKGKKFSLEYRKRLSEAHKGKKTWDRNSPEFQIIRQKLRETALKQWQNSREKMLAIFSSSEYKSKISNKQKALWQIPEERTKRIEGVKKSTMPLSIKKLWHQDWYRQMQKAKHIEAFEKFGRFPSKNTKIEQVLRSVFDKRALPLVSNKRVSNIAVPDFVNTDFKVAVFADGDFWHCNPEKNFAVKIWQIKRLSHDFNQNLELEKKGFAVLRFYESEIKENPERCADLVERAFILNGYMDSCA